MEQYQDLIKLHCQHLTTYYICSYFLCAWNVSQWKEKEKKRKDFSLFIWYPLLLWEPSPGFSIRYRAGLSVVGGRATYLSLLEMYYCFGVKQLKAFFSTLQILLDPMHSPVSCRWNIFRPQSGSKDRDGTGDTLIRNLVMTWKQRRINLSWQQEHVAHKKILDLICRQK